MPPSSTPTSRWRPARWSTRLSETPDLNRRDGSDAHRIPSVQSTGREDPPWSGCKRRGRFCRVSSGSVERRRLGRTGHESSVAILGGAACAAATPAEAGDWLQLAVERGVNHLDIAPQYGDAEMVVGPHLASRRPDMFVAGKTLRSNPDGVQDQFDATRRVLHSDVLDLYQAHAVTSLDELERRSGALERILQLRERGQTRFAGITGHDLSVPIVFLEALRRYDLDTVMFPIYPALWALQSYREPAEELLALCAARDIGVMGIKAVAHRRWQDPSPSASATSVDVPTTPRWATSWYEPVASDVDIDRGVRFALSTAGVHGFCTPGDIALLPRVLDAADRYEPLSPIGRQAAIDSMSSTESIFPMSR
jgi:aryl-alcohol dehydrogenase-like predicted oxidoreductase